MNGKRLVALAVLLLSSFRVAAADGLYLGAGIGIASIKTDVNGSLFDADDAAYRAFAGWRFDVVPLIDLAVEAAYTNFGKPSQSVAGQAVNFKLKGPSVAGLVILPIGPVDLYGKGGAISWKAERTINGVNTQSSGGDFFYGGGLGFTLWKVGLRLEYERYQLQGIDRLQMYSANVLFQF